MTGWLRGTQNLHKIKYTARWAMLRDNVIFCALCGQKNPPLICDFFADEQLSDKVLLLRSSTSPGGEVEDLKVRFWILV